MEKRFQVFVSSTFKDLEDERREVMHALLELDCIPAGMELFPATNETQWTLIKKVIEDSDYYVLILGGRYGSIGTEGLSYTEMEYRYALSIGKPTIAFLHRSPGKIVADKTESTDDGRKKLYEFRSLVEQKLCKHWDSASELGSVVSRSLIQLMRSSPAIGWVRASELADREAKTELLQLRRRVDELQSELGRLRTSAPKGAEGLAQGAEEHTFKFSFRARDPDTYESKRWTSSFSVSWDEIFSVVAPLMINEASETTIKSTLDTAIMNREGERLRSGRLKGQELHSFSLWNEDFQTLKVQLRALGLVTKSDKNRSVKDSGTYWTLTPYGDEVMTQLRAIRSHSDDEPINEETREAEAGE